MDGVSGAAVLLVIVAVMFQDEVIDVNSVTVVVLAGE
jgi:hypothetical protein